MVRSPSGLLLSPSQCLWTQARLICGCRLSTVQAKPAVSIIRLEVTEYLKISSLKSIFPWGQMNRISMAGKVGLDFFFSFREPRSVQSTAVQHFPEHQWVYLCSVWHGQHDRLFGIWHCDGNYNFFDTQTNHWNSFWETKEIYSFYFIFNLRKMQHEKVASLN